MRKFKLFALSIASLYILSGCGQATKSPALQVSNLINYEKVTPDPHFDPQKFTNATQVLASLNLVTSTGKPVHLENSTHPIMFQAYWCPHCQRTLLLFTQNPILKHSGLILISSGYPLHTTLQQAVATTQKEFKELGISGFPVYYELHSIQVPSYPALIFKRAGSSYLLTGEHTEKVWEEAVR